MNGTKTNIANPDAANAYFAPRVLKGFLHVTTCEGGRAAIPLDRKPTVVEIPGGRSPDGSEYPRTVRICFAAGDWVSVFNPFEQIMEAISSGKRTTTAKEPQ